MLFLANVSTKVIFFYPILHGFSSGASINLSKSILTSYFLTGVISISEAVVGGITLYRFPKSMEMSLFEISYFQGESSGGASLFCSVGLKFQDWWETLEALDYGAMKFWDCWETTEFLLSSTLMEVAGIEFSSILGGAKFQDYS